MGYILKKIDNQDKEILFISNSVSPEDEREDTILENLEVWDDGTDSITLFMC